MDMANKINPITDRDIILAAADKFMTRGEIAKRIARSLHPALIERIERLARDGHLYRDEGRKPNRVIVYYYRSTAEAAALAREAERATPDQQQQSFMDYANTLTEVALQRSIAAEKA
jgi:hypothetical protein